jgi:hypothetical protein
MTSIEINRRLFMAECGIHVTEIKKENFLIIDGVQCRRCYDKIFPKGIDELVWCRCGGTYVEGDDWKISFSSRPGLGIPRLAKKYVRKNVAKKEGGQ